jgi:transcriptional regulator with PAS, ATPase and Fis domain
MTDVKRTPEGERTFELSVARAPHPVVTILWEGGSLTQPLPSPGSAVVGRGSGADINVDERSISRRHAALHVAADLEVEDLGSSNGTRVRGRILDAGERVKVDWGEPIELGGTIAIVRPPGPVQRPTPAASSVGSSAMRETERLVELVAPTDISVLLLGETGAGKGHLARMIHDHSRRASGPWLHLNCAALPENLLESELFGYERGAFTGAAQSKPGLLESASGGTVFLDEIGDLPAAIQAKLLITLERREVLRLGALKPRPFDVRFISATNRELDSGGKDGFRSDLFFRLAGLTISIPPLRERTDELPTLVTRFLASSAEKLGRPVPTMTREAFAALESYDFPGNVRELAAILERALLFAKDSIKEEHLGLKSSVPARPAGRGTSAAATPSSPGAPAQPTLPPAQPSAPRTLAEDIGDIERRRIVEALDACAGNQSRAAEMLGISRRTLISRMIAFGLPRPRKG